MIRAIPSDDFAAVYPHVERFFANFYERAKGSLTPGTLEREILSKDRQCYVATREGQVVACALSTVSPVKTVTLDFCAGDDDENWPEDMIAMFEAWAADLGGRLIVICRSGWVRRLKMTKRGYRETHRIMELG